MIGDRIDPDEVPMPTAQAAPLKRIRERPDSAAPGFQRVRLTVAYDGSAYLGWQVQVEGASVQGCLETALGKLFASAPPGCQLQSHRHWRSCPGDVGAFRCAPGGMADERR